MSFSEPTRLVDAWPGWAGPRRSDTQCCRRTVLGLLGGGGGVPVVDFVLLLCVLSGPVLLGPQKAAVFLVLPPKGSACSPSDSRALAAELVCLFLMFVWCPCGLRTPASFRAGGAGCTCCAVPSARWWRRGGHLSSTPSAPESLQVVTWAPRYPGLVTFCVGLALFALWRTPLPSGTPRPSCVQELGPLRGTRRRECPRGRPRAGRRAHAVPGGQRPRWWRRGARAWGWGSGLAGEMWRAGGGSAWI